MTGYWFDVTLIAVLMVVNGMFAGSEIALISLREGQLKALERRRTWRARTVVQLARDPNRFLGTIQLGITLAGYLASATAAVTLAQPVVTALRGLIGDAADAAGIGAVTLALAAVNLVVGELAPKRLGMQYAQGWALAAVGPLNVLAIASRPLTWLLGAATDVLVRLVGGDPHAGKEQLTPEELRELVVGHPGLSTQQRTIITGALEIRERTLREVLVPRRAVVALPADMAVMRARTVLAQAGHSRAPVVRDHELDDAVGVVHLRDLLAERGTVGDVVRPALELPESLHVSDALRRLRAERQQFALVIDERGGVAGIITIEDLLEEIVGEIYDETDLDILAVRRMPDGTIVIPGTFPIHDLPDIDVEIDSLRGDYTTIAGLVLARLGRIPSAPGDRVEVPGWTIEVTGVGQHTITEIQLVPARAQGLDSDQG